MKIVGKLMYVCAWGVMGVLVIGGGWNAVIGWATADSALAGAAMIAAIALCWIAVTLHERMAECECDGDGDDGDDLELEPDGEVEEFVIVVDRGHEMPAERPRAN